MSGLILPPEGMILGPDGLPLAASGPPDRFGLDVTEATGGVDILEATKQLADLRRRREMHGYIVIAPGQVTGDFIADCAVFNAEVYARAYKKPELTDRDRDRIRDASLKRWKRGEKRRAQDARRVERERAAAVRKSGEDAFQKMEVERFDRLKELEGQIQKDSEEPHADVYP